MTLFCQTTNQFRTYFDFVSGSRVEIIEFNFRFDGLDVGRSSGVVSDVDDHVLLLLRRHVGLPGDVQAAFQRLNVLDDGRSGSWSTKKKFNKLKVNKLKCGKLIKEIIHRNKLKSKTFCLEVNRLVIFIVI